MVPSTIQINAVSHPATFRALLEMEYDHGAVNRLEPEPASFVIPVRFGERLSAIEAEFVKMTESEMTEPLFPTRKSCGELRRAPSCTPPRMLSSARRGVQRGKAKNRKMSNTIHHVGGCAGDCDEPEAHAEAAERSALKCGTCDAPAVRFYVDDEPPERAIFACDDCCGHNTCADVHDAENPYCETETGACWLLCAVPAYVNGLRDQLNALDEATASRIGELKAELAEARAELNPTCADETLIGAIRNLRQAHISERDNAEELERQLTAANVEIDRLKALVPHTMRLTDTCHGMTGGDLYTCGNCGSYVVVRAEAAAPKCPSRKKERE